MARDQESLLTEDAKREIRGYLFRMFIPSAVFIAAVSAIFGFLINGLTHGLVFENAMKPITEAATKASEASTRAEEARNQIISLLTDSKNQITSLLTDSKGQIGALLIEVNKAVFESKTARDSAVAARVDVDRMRQGDLDFISTRLSADGSFRDKLNKLTDHQYKDLDSKIESMEKAFDQKIATLTGNISGASNRSLKCEKFANLSQNSSAHALEIAASVPQDYILTGGGCNLVDVESNKWSFIRSGTLSDDGKGWYCRSEPIPNFGFSRKVAAVAIGCKIE